MSTRPSQVELRLGRVRLQMAEAIRPQRDQLPHPTVWKKSGFLPFRGRGTRDAKCGGELGLRSEDLLSLLVGDDGCLTHPADCKACLP